MSLDDVEEILFDGTEEQIEEVRCPECGGSLKFSYFPITRNMEIVCRGCNTVVRANGAEKTPNFALVKGNV